MKKASKLMFVVLMLVLALFAVTACPSSDEVSEIKITTRPMQLTFVQGQELNLDGGILTVVEDGAEITMSLNDPRIAIEGYDNQKLGQQQITLYYGGKSTTLSVVVAKRIATDSKVMLDYFVGESFNKNDGKITVTDDDGNQTEYPFNDSRVVVSGLENFSAAAGQKALTVTCGQFSDTLSVNVYEVASSSLSIPEETFYDTHVTEMNFYGGFITLTAPNNACTKTIPLTSDMIANNSFNPNYFEFASSTDVIPSNFELQNNGEYLRSQQVEINYIGQRKFFNVGFTYSDVSRINRYAEILSRPVADGGVDYANIANILNGVSGYNFTTEQLEMATAAAEIFLDLDKPQQPEGDENQQQPEQEDLRSLVTDEVRACFLPIATYSYYVDWFYGFIGEEEGEGYGDYMELLLTANSTVEVSFVGDTYEKAKASYVALTDGPSGEAFRALSVKNEYLWKILGDEELAVSTFYTKDNGDVVTLAAGCAYAVSQEEIESQIYVLEYLIELYEMFHNSQNNITHAALVSGQLSAAQKAIILDVYEKIIASPFFGYRNYYAIISSWGEGDFYEVLYQYFYDLAMEEMRVHPENNNWQTNEHLMTLAYIGYYASMPADVEAFYTYSYYVYQTFGTFSENEAMYGGIMDSTELFVYYNGVMGMLEYFDTINADGSITGSEDNSEARKASRLLSKNLMEVMEFIYYPYVTTEVLDPVTGETYEAPLPIAADEVIDGFKYNYLYLTENMYESIQFERLINDYMELINGYFNGDFFDVVDNGDGTSSQDWGAKFFEAVPAFIQKLITYSPDIQTAFVVTLSDNPALMFDVQQEAGYTYAGALLLTYHDLMLKKGHTTVVTYDEEEYDVFAQMLIAYENYIRDGYNYTETDTYSVSSFLGYFRDGYYIYDSEGIEIISTVPSVIDLYEMLDRDALDADQLAMIDALYNYLDKVSRMYIEGNDGLTYIGSSINDYDNWGTEEGETKAYWEARFKGFANELGKYYVAYTAGENYYAIAPFIAYALHIDDEYAKLVAEIDALEDEALKADLFDIMAYTNFGIFDGRYVGDKLKLGSGNFTIELFYNYFRSYYTTLIANITVFGSEVFGSSAQGYERLFYHWDENLAAFFESGAETMHIWTEVTFAGGLSVASRASVRDVENADAFFKTYLSMTELTSAQKAIFRELNFYPTMPNQQGISSEDHFMMPFVYFYLNKLGYDTTQSGSWNQRGEEYKMYYAIRSFINLVNSYVDYSYYIERYEDFSALDGNFESFFSSIRGDYETCVAEFNQFFGQLSETQKAAFTAEFDEDLIDAYLENPAQQA